MNAYGSMPLLMHTHASLLKGLKIDYLCKLSVAFCFFLSERALLLPIKIKPINTSKVTTTPTRSVRELNNRTYSSTWAVSNPGGEFLSDAPFFGLSLWTEYVFVHDAILESLTCGDTQITPADVRTQIKKLEQRDSAGKLRMRKWVELFEEPRPSFEVLAISELPRVINFVGVSSCWPCSSKKELCTLWSGGAYCLQDAI